MNALLRDQLALDFCCEAEDLEKPGNLFTEYVPLDGRRRWAEVEDIFLKIASVDGKLLMSGRADIIDLCRRTYADGNAAWIADGGELLKLDALVQPFGYRLHMAHPFFTADTVSEPPAISAEIVRYRGPEIEQFRGDSRFSEAYAFSAVAPDVLGVGAAADGKVVAMAGASADSPTLWQIGIDVLPEYRGRGFAAALVTHLKNDILAEGRLPFYGTASSHIASQRTALAAGFKPAWTEISFKRREPSC